MSAIVAAAVDMSRTGHNRQGGGRGGWPFVRVAAMLDTAGPDFGRHAAWGWKEPNSHIFIDHMATSFPDLQYIHVMRHGLDMAYSSNQQQVYNWAKHFGLDEPKGRSCPPDLAFRYWVEANRRAIELGEDRLGDRFLVLDFDRLCDRPLRAVAELLDHTGLRPGSERLGQIVKLPKTPPSSGRYTQFNLDWMTSRDIDALHELGYEYATRGGNQSQVE